jgi:phosphatidylglycerophosphatase A
MADGVFFKKLREFLVTGFFIGYIPFFPGLFGTLMGAGIYVLLSQYAFVYYPATALLLIISFPLSDFAEKHIFKETNSPHIVIDEIVGFLIAMASFPFIASWGGPVDSITLSSVKFLVIGIVLFRIFDSWKPFPIKRVLNIGGGAGIVLDDVIAAIYTNIMLQFLRIFDYQFHF